MFLKFWFTLILDAVNFQSSPFSKSRPLVKSARILSIFRISPSSFSINLVSDGASNDAFGTRFALLGGSTSFSAGLSGTDAAISASFSFCLTSSSFLAFFWFKAYAITVSSNFSSFIFIMS